MELGLLHTNRMAKYLFFYGMALTMPVVAN